MKECFKNNSIVWVFKRSNDFIPFSIPSLTSMFAHPVVYGAGYSNIMLFWEIIYVLKPVFSLVIQSFIALSVSGGCLRAGSTIDTHLTFRYTPPAGLLVFCVLGNILYFTASIAFSCFHSANIRKNPVSFCEPMVSLHAYNLKKTYLCLNTK